MCAPNEKKRKRKENNKEKDGIKNEKEPATQKTTIGNR